jgi:anti-sigma regulatory factor (Ser/Thr protein kinase)
MAIPARAEFLGVARHALRALVAGSPMQARVKDVEVALTEACTNAILHAESPDVTIRVSAILDDTGLTVQVTDLGRGFTAGERSPNTGLGLGLVLIERLSDRCRIRTGRRFGTRVRMHFRLPVAGGEGPAPGARTAAGGARGGDGGTPGRDRHNGTNGHNGHNGHGGHAPDPRSRPVSAG